MTPHLFLHAFAGAGRQWDAVRAALPEPLRGEAPDLPGFAGRAALSDTSLDGYRDWLEAQVATLGAPAVLVAHSMSGKLALALAAARPERVARLVLVAPSTPGAEPMAPGERALQRERFGDEHAARTAIEAATHGLDAQATARLVEDRLAASRTAWDWWLGAGSLDDIGPRMAAVRAPVAVVVGADDDALGEAAQRRHLLPRLSSQATLSVVPACGHFVPVEQAGALAAAILEHAG